MKKFLHSIGFHFWKYSDDNQSNYNNVDIIDNDISYYKNEAHKRGLNLIKLSPLENKILLSKDQAEVLSLKLELKNKIQLLLLDHNDADNLRDAW